MDAPFPTLGEAINEWAHNAPEPNPARCPCRGHGWLLSEYDSWHKCGEHYTGQTHPEYDEPDEDDEVPVVIHTPVPWHTKVPSDVPF